MSIITSIWQSGRNPTEQSRWGFPHGRVATIKETRAIVFLEAALLLAQICFFLTQEMRKRVGDIKVNPGGDGRDEFATVVRALI